MEKQTKKLTNLICLSHSVKVYIPSTTDIDTPICTEEYENKTLELLSNMFGGATIQNAYGCWNSQEKGLVKEKIKICRVKP